MSGFKIICEHCRNQFETNWAAAKYCSDHCRVTAYRERKKAEIKPTKICVGCYEHFLPKSAKARFCSAKCKMAYHRRNDYDGTYAPKNAVARFQPTTPIEVTYDEKQAIYDAWEGAL